MPDQDAQRQLAATISRIISLNNALASCSPNPYVDRINHASTPAAFYDAALALGYAANSKELRDTSDPQVHQLCAALLEQMAALDAFFTIKLFPASPAQQQSWASSAARDASARYAFRDDGSLETSVLDATLQASTLHVRRVWSHVSNFDGARTDFQLRLDAAQAQAFRQKLAVLRAFTLPAQA